MNLIRLRLLSSVQYHVKKNSLFGICNPMMDITSDVDEQYLSQFSLKKGESTIADDRNYEIFDDLLNNLDSTLTLGGATLNVFRCFSWMLQEEEDGGGTDLATFVGAIGSDGNGEPDEIGKYIIEKVAEDGVDGRFEIQEGDSASCAVLIVKYEDDRVDRTLVANLGVSSDYSTDHFLSEEIQDLVDEASMYYFSGYFIATNSEVFHLVADHASQHEEKKLGINLSAEFVIREFWDEIQPLVLENADFIFGNDEECGFFADQMGWSDIVGDTMETAKRIIETINEPNRYCVFTQGYRPICVAYLDSETNEIVGKEFPVEEVDVVDTNGAGDSFVGGFLSQIAKGEDIEVAVRAGIYSSSKIIQMSGVDFTIIDSNFQK